MIRCGIIGLGRIGSSLEDDTKREKPATHAGAVFQHKECAIVCGADIDKSKRERFASKWSCDKTYADAATMLQENSLDIVQIATPPDTHYMLLELSLKQKIPVIVLEKPVAETISMARNCLELYRDLPESKVLINHERRYSLQYRHVKELVKSKKYGTLLSMSCKLYMGRNRKIDEMLYDDGTHMVDLLHYLAGENLQLIHVAQSDDMRQLVVTARAGSVMTMIEVATGRDHLVFELDLSFERGRVVVGNGYYNEYASEESPFYEHFNSLRRQGIEFEKSEYFKRMFEEAVALFRVKEREPVSSLKDGVAALEAIEQILKRCKD